MNEPSTAQPRMPYAIHAFRLAAFLSAFLLFQVQPMATKALLPPFGGSHLVWGVAAAFFQGLLLLGYGYAHLAQERLGVRRYARWHWILLLAPLLLLPFDFRPIAAARGTPLVLAVPGVLLRILAFPVLTLATTSVILQRWLSVSGLPGSGNPYTLYGASNLGSMLGLLSYPLLVEPLLELHTQTRFWAVGFLVLVLLHLACRPGRNAVQAAGSDAQPVATSGPQNRRDLLAWFGLSAAGCALLLATTNTITLDISPVPLLWVLPLSLFLLSFVLTFSRRPRRPAWISAAFYWAAIVGLFLYLMPQLRITLPAWLSTLLYLVVLLVFCVELHGSLYKSRPSNLGRLTTFYLTIAFGGFCGSALVSWLAPLVTNACLEYPGAMLLAALSLAACARTQTRAAGAALPPRIAAARMAAPFLATVCTLTLLPWALSKFCGFEGTALFCATALPLALLVLGSKQRPLSLACVLLAVVVCADRPEALASGTRYVKKLRNYYGIYRVYDSDRQRFLQHGTTLHGREYLAGPQAGIPMSYYHPSAPASGILNAPAFPARDVAMIGLGAGALVAYARPDQNFTVFELDPDNLPIADRYFTFLRQARERGANLQFRFGDGRINLRETPRHSLDLLIVDTFNSGAVPVHLLTVEAFREYFAALRPSGLLLLHTSNKALDLTPIVHSVAAEIGALSASKTNAGNIAPGADLTVWMAVTHDKSVFRNLRDNLRWTPRTAPPGQLPRPWTDRYSNILTALF